VVIKLIDFAFQELGRVHHNFKPQRTPKDPTYVFHVGIFPVNDEMDLSPLLHTNDAIFICKITLYLQIKKNYHILIL
jgi:hypothetical protein